MIKRSRTVFVFMYVLFFLILFSIAHADNFHHNVGIGVGVPYGGLVGLNYEFEIDVNDSFAVGPTIGVSDGWDLGLHSHFLNKNKLIRLGLSAWYGTNGRLKSEYVDEGEDDKTFEGVTVGGNVRLQIGSSRKHVVDFHTLYIVSTNIDDDDRYERESDSDVIVALGYKYRF